MKMNVSQERLERILEIYRPDFRFLVEANVEYPVAEGKFRMGKTYYSTQPVGHLTTTEAKHCLDQLSLIAFGEWLQDGNISGLQIPFDSF